MNREPTKAVYAGSFDPLTEGHMWVIWRAAEIFDNLIVAVGVNPLKKPTFSVEERKEMIERSIPWKKSCKVESFENKYLVRYAQEVNATHIIRGMRNVGDFEFERLMQNINADIQTATNSCIQTVFLVPPRELAETSSSAVKALIGPEGWEEVVRPMVPVHVFSALKNKFGCTVGS